jgi:hypothetical protein
MLSMNDRLVVVLPGNRYGPLGPAVRFPVLACRQITEGETIEVVYPETNEDDPIPVRAQLLAAAVSEQVLPAIEQFTGDSVMFVAMSLGTRALASIAPSLPRGRSIAAVWISPLFGVEVVRSGAMQSGLRSLIIAGTADPYHDQNGFDAVRASLNADTLLIPGAGHELEVPGDLLATLNAMRMVSTAVLDFAR